MLVLTLLLGSVMVFSQQSPVDSSCLDPSVADSLESECLDTIPVEEEVYVMPEELYYETAPLISQDKRTGQFPGGWFFMLNAGLLVLLIFRIIVFREYTRKSWNAWVNENLFYQLIREKQPVNAIVVLVENVFRLYILTMVVLTAFNFFAGAATFSWPLFFRVALLIGVFYFIRLIVLTILAMVSGQGEMFKNQWLNGLIFASNAAYFFIPLFLLISYMDVGMREYGFYLVLGLFAFGLIWLAFRTFRVLLKTKAPLNMQFFVYLCALEIMPVLILIKVALNFNILR